MEIHKFPDGEIQIQLSTKDATICFDPDKFSTLYIDALRTVALLEVYG